MFETRILLAAYHISTTALGPGNRAGIWVQGCPFNCKGCIAPEWTLPGGQEWLPSSLAEKILDQNDLDGVTISGGEPMQQSKGLIELIRILRKVKPNLNVICFSGYRHKELVIRPPTPDVPDFLKEIDLLIDGPYIESLNDGVGLRGSQNQELHYLTDKLIGCKIETFPRKIEVIIQDGHAFIIGIPPLSFSSAWENVSLSLSSTNQVFDINSEIQGVD
jgi:anaerobic ribonucleoside-triphosphate reductase activating protein